MIRRLLVANRGEIARRIFTSCRDMGIETVAVYSDSDAGTPYVDEADYAVHLPGNAPSATYLRGDLLIDAARRAGADAIHPGYGFLSERADFAESAIDAGLTWIGPAPKSIALMGSKLEAKALMAEAGVATLPTWTDPSQVTEFPVMVKASAGGGGRGMRIVRDAAALSETIAAAHREASQAFGDGAVFCEPYVEGARHIEVQIMADAVGNCITFGERECSIQRRHQKLIEETPSPVVSPSMRDELCDAAVAVARTVDYVGAGTIEFLVTPAGDFYFLEMNTRLQVEHAVTECVGGTLDLVRLQILVAEGMALPFESAPPLRGHAIEARLYAEDPAAAWLPSTGALHRFRVPNVLTEFRAPNSAGIRVDSGVQDGSVIGVHYDPLLAKVIAWAPTRAEAARTLASTLARSQIHGVATNRDLLVRVLKHPSFQDGAFDTGFLDRHPEVFAPLVSSTDGVKLSCLAAALASAAGRRSSSGSIALPIGWRNVGGIPQVIAYDGPTGPVEVAYRFDRRGDLASWTVRSVEREDAGVPGVFADTDSEAHPPVAVVSSSLDRVRLDVAGVLLDFQVNRVESMTFVDSVEGSITLVELPRFPIGEADTAEGSLLAPMPGTIGRVLVTVGERVASGHLLMTVEAMKLEHPVHAPAAGVVASLPVGAGTQVDTGAVLAVITPESTDIEETSLEHRR